MQNSVTMNVKTLFLLNAILMCDSASFDGLTNCKNILANLKWTDQELFIYLHNCNQGHYFT